MKLHDWSKEKNEWLKKQRNVSFEDVLEAIQKGNIVNHEEHFNQKKYPNQKIYYVEIAHYVYVVPYVEKNDVIFLKTIIPSRKATKLYL